MRTPIEHVMVLSGMSPNSEPPAVIEAARPILRWNAVQGADKYVLQYNYTTWPALRRAGTSQPKFRSECNYTFETDVPTGMICIWSVYALNKEGQRLAGGGAQFLTRGTDSHPPATSATTMPAEGPSGRGYIGLRVWQKRGMPYAIVDDILPESPASHSDLRPGDQIERVNGKSSANSTSADLQRFIAGLKAGERLKLDIRRRLPDGSDKSEVIEITVGEQ